jgi:hypothetical protein
MRARICSGPLLVALGVALAGCTPSGDSPPKGASHSASKTSPSQADAGTKPVTENASASQVVLGIEGMT